MANPKLEAAIDITTAWSIHLHDGTGGGFTHSDTITVAAGTYYLCSATGLLSTIQTALDAANLANNYTVTLDDTADTATGKITITAGSGAGDVFGIETWSGTPSPATVLGTAATPGWPAGTHAYTGTSQAQYLWLPTCGRGPGLAPDGDEGAMECDTTQSIAPSGRVKTLYYNERLVDVLSFAYLRGSNVWQSKEATTNESLQRFWRQSVRNGTQFRYYPSRDTDGTYVTWVGEYAPFADQCKPVDPNWTNSASSLWSWQCRVRKYV